MRVRIGIVPIQIFSSCLKSVKRGSVLHLSVAASFQAVSAAALLSSGPFLWTVGLLPCILMLLGLEAGLLARPSSPF